MLDVLVVGLGSIGRRHARIWANLGANVTGVDPIVAHDSLDLPLAGVFANLDRLRAARGNLEPALVIVATPSAQHVDDLLNLADRWPAAKIFVEKPLATSQAQLGRIKEWLADSPAAGERVTVAGNMRFHTGPATIHQALAKVEVYGQPLALDAVTGSYLPNWRPKQDYRENYAARRYTGGGVILDGIHELDLAIWLAGRVSKAAGMVSLSRSLEIETEDRANLVLRHANGVQSHVAMNYLDRGVTRRLQLVTSEGTLLWDWHEPQVTFRHERGLQVIAAWDPDGEVDRMYVRQAEAVLSWVSASSQSQTPHERGALSTLPLAIHTTEVALKVRDQSLAESHDDAFWDLARST